MRDAQAMLVRCYRAAIAAVEPAGAMQEALRRAAPPSAPAWILAVGKAAPGMAAGLAEWLAAHGQAPAGGLIVTADSATSPHPALPWVLGDHPVPRLRSLRASNAITTLIERIPPNAEVHVAISGGASALIASPLPGLTMPEVTASFEWLLRSGMDIHQVNAVRKRLTRWSAGRLALALAPRRCMLWLISDVPGDQPESIASGPCSGDPWRSDDVVALAEVRHALDPISSAVATALRRETPKPGDRYLVGIVPHVVANNARALAAAAECAARDGIASTIAASPLAGDAAAAGRSIAAALGEPDAASRLLLWGGETTVTLGRAAGHGGRSQELALAAAGVIRGGAAVLLAAGTDGRDGPTDAAGAVVNGETWDRIIAAGRDPARDLVVHDAYPALDAAGALLRTGPTGTNVMDVVLGFSARR